MNIYALKDWWSRLNRKGQRALQHLVYKDVHMHRPNLHAWLKSQTNYHKR